MIKSSKPIILRTLGNIRRIVGDDGRVLVAYSGGKDSSVVLDLCLRLFPSNRVYAYHLEIVPGLKSTEEILQYPKSKGVRVVVARSLNYFLAKSNGDFCLPIRLSVDLSLVDLQLSIMNSLDCNIIFTGERAEDGLFRRGAVKKVKDGFKSYGFTYECPIYDWTKEDILAYVRARGLPVYGMSHDMDSSGVLLIPKSLCWLYENKPEDFAILEQYFPFVRAAVYRSKWYNVDNERYDMHRSMPDDVEFMKEVKWNRRKNYRRRVSSYFGLDVSDSYKRKDDDDEDVED